MGQAIPPIVRRRIVELCQSGKTAKEVSQLLELGYPGVAKVWRCYRQQGEASLALKYDHCGRKSNYGDLIREEINQVRNLNKELGAPIIRSRLLAQGNFDKVPHERTIQRWWKDVSKSNYRGRRPRVERNYAKEPHDTWQLDAKEQVCIEDSSQHTYLSFTDEATCAFLKGHVFPLHSSD